MTARTEYSRHCWSELLTNFKTIYSSFYRRMVLSLIVSFFYPDEWSYLLTSAVNVVRFSRFTCFLFKTQIGFRIKVWIIVKTKFFWTSCVIHTENVRLVKSQSIGTRGIFISSGNVYLAVTYPEYQSLFMRGFRFLPYLYTMTCVSFLFLRLSLLRLTDPESSPLQLIASRAIKNLWYTGL